MAQGENPALQQCKSDLAASEAEVAALTQQVTTLQTQLSTAQASLTQCESALEQCKADLYECEHPVEPPDPALEIPGTIIEPLIHPTGPLPPPYVANDKQMVIKAWNGAAFDYQSNTMYLPVPGGHNDWSPNESFAIKVPSGPSKRLHTSSTFPPTDAGIPDVVSYSDGKPASRHTYGGAVWLPDQNCVMMLTGSTTPTGGGDWLSAWLDATGKWTYKRSLDAGYYGLSAMYHAARKVVIYGYATDRLTVYDPVADTHTRIAQDTNDPYAAFWGDRVTLVLDPVGEHLYAFNKSGWNNGVRLLKFKFWQTTAQSWQEVAVTGESDALIGTNPGIEYDAELKAFVLFALEDPSHLTILPLDTLVARRVAIPAVDVSKTTLGIFGRFRKYAPNKFCLLTDVTKPLVLIDLVDVPVEPPIEPSLPSDTGVLKPTPSGALCFYEWHNNAGAYQRSQVLRMLETTAESVRFFYLNSAATLPLGEYRLVLVGGPVVATLNLTVPTSDTSIIVNAHAIGVTGDQQFQIQGPNQLFSIAMWMHVNPGGAAVSLTPATIPVETGSYDKHEGVPYLWAKVPSANDPPHVPLPEREYPPFSTALPVSELYRSNPVPWRSGNIFRPNVNHRGVISTKNPQCYYYEDLRTPFPKLHLLEGTRGFGSVPQATFIQVDSIGGAYFSTSHSVGRVLPSGLVWYRCGAVHKGIPGNHKIPGDIESQFVNAYAAKQWEHAADLYEEWMHLANVELRGDWSAVPRHLRRFQEIWGMAWYMKTLANDPNAEPIGGRQPHIEGPQMLVASAGNDTVYRLTYTKDQHQPPPKVTVFAGDLAHPFSCIEVNGKVYVSERDANRISIFDAATGARTGTLISASLVEGLWYRNGRLYFTERIGATGYIKSIDLASQQVVTRKEIPWNQGWPFLQIAGSDGTFGPEETIFYTTWSNVPSGYPHAILPDGTEWNVALHGGLIGGRGGHWNNGGYASACGVGSGRMYGSASTEGMYCISKALDTDPVLNEDLFWTGLNEYIKAGYNLVHGHYTWGHNQLPLPVTTSNSMNYFMQHARI